MRTLLRTNQSRLLSILAAATFSNTIVVASPSTAFCATTMPTTTTTATTSTAPVSIKKIPNKKLYVSEPNPYMFGNSANPKNDPKWTNANWLKSRFHFSFAEYHSRHNGDFGVLRVMNDDLVQPHRGFGTHPHANMEIITYIVHGELTHEDSMGTKESLRRGSIQFMTAGTGIRHSEFNHGDEPLRFVQTWIKPSKPGLQPNYGSYAAPKPCDASRKNKVHHLVSNVLDKSTSTPVEINQNVDAIAAEMSVGEKVTYDLPAGRQAYLLCVEGGIKLNDASATDLEKYDACEIAASSSACTLEIEATATEETENGSVAHFLMFIMDDHPGSGRSDI